MFCERNFRESYPTEDCRLRRLSFKISRFYFLVILLIIKGISGQTFNIQGNVVTEDLTPVKYAAVTFIDQNDTTQRFSTVTDTLGDYRLSVTTAIDHLDFNLPSTIELAQNYPNPFSGSTLIRYQTAKSAEVSIKIYNLLGQEVRELKSPSHAAGVYGLTWDGKDNYSKLVASGIYFYQLQAGNEIKVKKMLYGLGGANTYTGSDLNSMNYIRASSLPMELNKEKKISVNTGTFSVKIENTDSTRPRIIQEEISDIDVKQDMSLYFHVEPDTSRILWGQSIEHIEIGFDSLSVIKELGPPSYILDGDFNGYILCYDVGRLKYTFVTISKDPYFGLGVISVVVEGPYPGTTIEGVGINSERDFVINAIGNPDTTKNEGDPLFYDVYYYAKNRFVNNYEYNLIKRIVMNPPNSKP
ncbi:MAG: T9SS type A sorting domain-containing protein [Candidatus Neomarinimicrobiota bacterium]